MSQKYLSQWDNSSIYQGLEDPQIAADLQELQEQVSQLKESALGLVHEKAPSVPDVGKISQKRRQILDRLWQLRTFASCESSRDAKSERALDLEHQCRQLFSRFHQAIIPLERFLTLADDDWTKEYLAMPTHQSESGRIRFLRDKASFVLEPQIEELLKDFEVEGKASWFQLYESLSGATPCHVEKNGQVETMSMAQAAANLSSAEESTRQSAFLAITQAWENHEQTSAIMLNSQIGWRLKEDRLRSKKLGEKAERGYLDVALETARMSKDSLDTMMNVLNQRGKALGQRAARLQAHVLGKPHLQAWDQLASLPDGGNFNLEYDHCVDLIADSCRSLGEEASDFVKMAGMKGWIDADNTPHRRTGAYCTGFAVERTPRVFMTYQNQGKHAITLAHELGHAYHAWVMKELSRDQTTYPMTLAETASTLFETLFKDHLENSSASESAEGSDAHAASRLAGWENIKAAAVYLLDVPRRFHFESETFERIGQGERLSAATLCEIMKKHSQNFFGSSMEVHDERIWQSKVHFYMPGIRFYNYPYTFGYLFSLAIYRHHQDHQSSAGASSFTEMYKSLLMDTGTLTCEEVASKHLGKDLTKADFWNDSLDIVEAQIDRAEKRLGSPQ